MLEYSIRPLGNCTTWLAIDMPHLRSLLIHHGYHFERKKQKIQSLVHSTRFKTAQQGQVEKRPKPSQAEVLPSLSWSP